MVAKVPDPAQQADDDAEIWLNEPLGERHASLVVHTDEPFNAEPPNRALMDMVTAKGLHFRRNHKPVPLVDEASYRLAVGIEGCDTAHLSLADLKGYTQHEFPVTLLCTGNRRSELNTKEDGETIGLPWQNGCISTAKWKGALLKDVLRAAGVDESAEEKGFRFLTFRGLEGFHVSIPLKKAMQKDGDCLLAWAMNGEPLPRDHGFPLRVVVPGYIAARSVKWIKSIVATREECDGLHQTGIAYKQLGPYVKKLSAVSKEYILALPPIDHVPVSSAITSPEPNEQVSRGQRLNIAGYAYSGAGRAIIRVDVSLNGGRSWMQADLFRAAETQGVRSGRAWAWVQWRCVAVVPETCSEKLTIVCKAVDDQYNQQPHDGSAIWNLRGILNTSWGRVHLDVKDGFRQPFPAKL